MGFDCINSLSLPFYFLCRATVHSPVFSHFYIKKENSFCDILVAYTDDVVLFAIEERDKNEMTVSSPRVSQGHRHLHQRCNGKDKKIKKKKKKKTNKNTKKKKKTIRIYYFENEIPVWEIAVYLAVACGVYDGVFLCFLFSHEVSWMRS